MMTSVPVSIYRRHSKTCAQRWQGVKHLKCNCPIWFRAGGVQSSAKTRDMEIAKHRARALEDGTVAPSVKLLTSATYEWLNFRELNNLGNEKPTLMVKKLCTWATVNGIQYLHELTSEAVIKFRNSLPYATSTSSSLKVHWSVICGFFGWCCGMKYISENPVPNTKVYPAFRIKFTSPEVVPPTPEEIDKVLAACADRKLWLFVQTMRHSGMAIGDTLSLTRSKLTGNVISGRRRKTSEKYQVHIPSWLADALRESTLDESFFIDDADVHKAVLVQEGKLRKLFKLAGVSMTSHRLRHFFITQQLAAGFSADEVSDMVGTSPSEIRKTYKHFVTEGRDRIASKQSEIWLSQGLDADGNKPAVN